MRKLTDLLRVTTLPLLVAILLAACTPTEPAEDALLDSGGGAIYTDGTYTVSLSHTGNDGWQPHLRIEVRAGLITSVCFGALDARGTPLAENGNFLERVWLDDGSDILRLNAELESLLLSEQQLRFALPAADLNPELEWIARFVLLADAALNLARDGAGPTLVLANPGPYIGGDAPDELGWQARSAFMFGDNRVIAASFEERRSGNDGNSTVKAEDPVYTEAYERVMELTPAVVAEQLCLQLLGLEGSAHDGPVRVDGVTGATGTTDRFQLLANRVISRRIAVSLPKKLCDD